MVAKWLYDLGIRLYVIAIHVAALFNDKARQWIKGRQGLFEKIHRKVAALPDDRTTVWVHCASLGEFEQGRPVIELLKIEEPQLNVILSFFSPSGFEVRKNYPLADLVCYLPADTAQNARKFIQATQPDLAIFVKYEFWYHHLRALRQQAIPTLLISAIFRPNQLFFQPYGKFFQQMLYNFDHIFVQNKESGQLLQKLGADNFSFGGDSRVDRVADIANAPDAYPIVAEFCKNAKVLIAGSTWPPDEEILLDFINSHLPADWKVVLAPHQISKGSIEGITRALALPHLLYSQAKETSLNDQRVLIIDNVGMLSQLYQYGKLAYIGGGFGAGIHNTLEPIAFGLPLFFGPKYQKFAEANYLVGQGAAVVVKNKTDLVEGFIAWQNEAHYREAARLARQYIQSNQGASSKIVKYIRGKFFSG